MAAQRGAATGDGAANKVGDLRYIERFRNVVEGTVAQPPNCGVERAVPSHHDDFDIWIELFNALHDLDAGHYRHTQVESHHIDRRGMHDLDRLLTTTRHENVV